MQANVMPRSFVRYWLTRKGWQLLVACSSFRRCVLQLELYVSKSQVFVVLVSVETVCLIKRRLPISINDAIHGFFSVDFEAQQPRPCQQFVVGMAASFSSLRFSRPSWPWRSAAHFSGGAVVSPHVACNNSGDSASSRRAEGASPTRPTNRLPGSTVVEEAAAVRLRRWRRSVPLPVGWH
jgi:hypothetical protein